MSTRERPIDRGRRLARADLLRIGAEIRAARRIIGRSIEAVAASAGMSPSTAGRIERGAHRAASVEQIARLAAVVGLDLRTRAYPGPDPTLDHAQLRLVDRLRARVHGRVTVNLEVPLPVEGDQRAWDGVLGRLSGIAPTIPFDAETRIIDVQAQLRRVHLKARDSGFEHVLLVVADTRRNREALASASALLEGDFPVSTRAALAALAAGRHPGGSSILVL